MSETSVRSVAVQVQNITHKYGDRLSLDNVSFDIVEGEIFGLLGPNGSGKTSLFRILSTMMIPLSGRATIMGFDSSIQQAQVRRSIGVVFQASSVDLKLTVWENLRHQGHLYGLRGSALRKRAFEMLERVGLTDRSKERVETLSGGMRRRVELAKGLMHRPRLLLLDEPTTGLDPGARRDLWQYLKLLRDFERVTVVVTTHLMDEAEDCDRLGILNEGRLVALGSPLELRTEIGGEVIVLTSSQPEALAERVHARFGGSAPRIIEGKVRLERERANQLFTPIMEAFADDILAVSVSKPTLEDVFIARTGHKFWINSPSKSQD